MVTICTARKGMFESAQINELPNKWNKSTVTYCLLQGTQDISDQHEISIAVNLMFSTWGAEIPIKFQKVLSNQNPDISYSWVSGKDDPVIKGDNSIMGYTDHFPDDTPIHIILNDDLLWNFTHTNFGWDPNNTLLHETGHALGLVHSPQDNVNIMSPVYNGVIELGDLDKQRIHAKYGVRTYPSLSFYQRLVKAIDNWKKSLH